MARSEKIKGGCKPPAILTINKSLETAPTHLRSAGEKHRLLLNVAEFIIAISYCQENNLASVQI